MLSDDELAAQHAAMMVAYITYMVIFQKIKQIKTCHSHCKSEYSAKLYKKKKTITVTNYNCDFVVELSQLFA